MKDLWVITNLTISNIYQINALSNIKVMNLLYLKTKKVTKKNKIFNLHIKYFSK